MEKYEDELGLVFWFLETQSQDKQMINNGIYAYTKKVI